MLDAFRYELTEMPEGIPDNSRVATPSLAAGYQKRLHEPQLAQPSDFLIKLN